MLSHALANPGMASRSGRGGGCACDQRQGQAGLPTGRDPDKGGSFTTRAVLLKRSVIDPYSFLPYSFLS